MESADSQGTLYPRVSLREVDKKHSYGSVRKGEPHVMDKFHKEFSDDFWGGWHL
jgi:hypothetical protein